MKYQNLSDEELLQLWGERSQLLEEAQLALESEIRNRGLSKPTERPSSTRQETEEPKATLSEYAPFAIIPICVLAAVIIFFVLPVGFRDRWSDVIYVVITCVAGTLLIVRPEGLFRKCKSALFGWGGLLVCAGVAAFVIKWGDAGGRTLLWRGKPIPAGVIFGMVAFLAAYLTLFFGFGMFRSGSAKRSASQGEENSW